MTFNPYDVLGIDRHATVPAIKAAYRRRARATHPDIAKTTDAGPFQAVVLAFAILSDPARRKKFDETGATDETDPIEEQRAAMGVLAGLFEQMVDAASKEGVRLGSLNYIAGLRAMVAKNRSSARDTQIDLRDQIEERLALRGRITRQNDGPNLFADRLTKQIEALGKALSDQEQRSRILIIAEIELGNYTNEVELVAAFQTMSYGYAPGFSEFGRPVTRTWPT